MTYEDEAIENIKKEIIKRKYVIYSHFHGPRIIRNIVNYFDKRGFKVQMNIVRDDGACRNYDFYNDTGRVHFEAHGNLRNLIKKGD